MKAKLYYLTLSDEQIAKVNSEGWGAIEGCYLQASMGYDAQKQVEAVVAANAAGLYQFIGTVKTDTAEQVFKFTQNLSEIGWVEEGLGSGFLLGTEGEGLEKTGTCYAARSMMVGDVIVWENGKVEVCASCGFNNVEGWA